MFRGRRLLVVLPSSHARLVTNVQAAAAIHLKVLLQCIPDVKCEVLHTRGLPGFGRCERMDGQPHPSQPHTAAHLLTRPLPSLYSPYPQDLLRSRKARKAAAAAAATQPAGMRQVSQARLMHTSFTAARQSDRPSCASLQEARTRCLDQLGDFLLMQESRQLPDRSSQQLPLQQNWSTCALWPAWQMPCSATATMLAVTSYSCHPYPRMLLLLLGERITYQARLPHTMRAVYQEQGGWLRRRQQRLQCVAGSSRLSLSSCGR